MLRIGVRLLGQRVYCQHCGGGFRATDVALENAGAIRVIEDLQENRIETLLELAAESISDSLKCEQSPEEDTTHKVV